MLQAEAARPPSPVEFTCPMDPDVRSTSPGKCPRCGMKLEARIQQPVVFQLRLTASPKKIPVGQPTRLTFELVDPVTGKRATQFETVHEKLFHLFLVGDGLNFFVHDHPVPQADGTFAYTVTLPHAGVYKLLADVYPSGASPQLLPAFLTTARFAGPVQESLVTPPVDLVPKSASNLKVSLHTEPAQPRPGTKTMLFFDVEPGDKLEPYLGAWGHLLAASSDLIDTIHEHPIYADGKPRIQFNVVFPREGVYRVWVQFQRNGVVNTAAFTLRVAEPR